jgi:glycosyltransferase involved in cell wall biosynthesis
MATVMQVLPSLISGGVERGTIEIAKYLVENGYKSIVVSSGGNLVPEIEKHSSIHIKINIESKNPFNLWRNIANLSEIIKEHQVNLVHSRSRAPAWSCYYAAQKSGIGFVTTVHGIYKINNFLKKFYNSIMTRGDRVIAVSNFVKKYLLENYNIDKSKIRVISRGVDSVYYDSNKLDPIKITKFRQKYNVPQGMPVILLPARFTNWKGQKLLVQAIEKIKNLNFYCIIVGDLAKHQDYVSDVKDMISSKRLQKKIQVFGSESDMLNLYGIADIILSTSIEPEAFGRTIIEAQSMEKLVIASNIGGASETIEDEKTGLHFASTDANDLADKIRYALEIIGTEKYFNLCKSARLSTIQNYSLQIMLQKTLEVYKELL